MGGALAFRTDSTGANVADVNEYDAFGNPTVISGSDPTPYGYGGQAGYQTDRDTGWMLAGNRYYDPSIGRFLSRDPAQSGDNWYAYCNNNPVTGLDPLGLQEGSGGGGGLSGTSLLVAGGTFLIAEGGNLLHTIGSDISSLFGGGGGGSSSNFLSVAQKFSGSHFHFSSASSASSSSSIFNSGDINAALNAPSPYVSYEELPWDPLDDASDFVFQHAGQSADAAAFVLTSLAAPEADIPEAEAAITTVIGRGPDIIEYAGEPGYDTWLDSGAPRFGNMPTWSQNQQWLQEHIDRGDNFLLATPESELSLTYVEGVPNGNFTFRELRHLRANGIEPTAKW